jgi:hypothetical protein
LVAIKTTGFSQLYKKAAQAAFFIRILPGKSF